MTPMDALNTLFELKKDEANDAYLIDDFIEKILSGEKDDRIY